MMIGRKTKKWHVPHMQAENAIATIANTPPRDSFGGAEDVAATTSGCANTMVVLAAVMGCRELCPGWFRLS